MATHLAARRNPALIALMGGFMLIAGMGSTHAAYADDDDWHTEANRPVEPQQQLKDRKDIQSIAAVRPQRDQIYAPRSTLQPQPTERHIDSAYQTAAVDKPQH
jgi:hypothetical protein